ncbi:MAG: hypothetical protein EA001_09585 [Oscillatoriales cyanobacterium]|nr:MAG: hypothetical protein EA001_09585 [Oscillatoriales cyanobacterium]
MVGLWGDRRRRDRLRDRRGTSAAEIGSGGAVRLGRGVVRGAIGSGGATGGGANRGRGALKGGGGPYRPESRRGAGGVTGRGGNDGSDGDPRSSAASKGLLSASGADDRDDPAVIYTAPCPVA